MAVNDLNVFRDPNTGDVGLKESDTGKEFYWDADRKGWYAQDEFGEFQIAGDQNRGSSNVQAIDYAVAEQDGNTTLLVKTDDGIRLDDSMDVSSSGNTFSGSYNQDQSLFGVCTDLGEIFIYQTTDFNLITSFTIPNGTIASSIDWNSYDEFCITSDGSEVYVYDSNYNLVQTITKANDTTAGVSFNDNDDRLVFGSWDSNFYVYDRNESTGEYVFNQSIKPGSGKISSVDWYEKDGLIAVYEYGSEKVHVYDTNYNLLTTIQTGNTNLFSLDQVTWRNDGYLALTAIGDDRVEIYDSDYNFVTNLNNVDPSGFSCLDFDNDKKLAIGASNGKIYIYDSNFNLFKTFDEPESNVYTTNWNKSGEEELATVIVSKQILTYTTQRNQLNLSDSTLPDGFDLSVANDGTGIIEINEDGTTILSDVGNAPKLIDNGATADINKIDSDRYLVEGDIYEETSDGFERT